MKVARIGKKNRFHDGIPLEAKITCKTAFNNHIIYGGLVRRKISPSLDFLLITVLLKRNDILFQRRINHCNIDSGNRVSENRVEKMAFLRTGTYSAPRS